MDIVEQITGAIDSHETEVKQGIDMVGDFIDSKTEGQYHAQVDQAQDFLKIQLGGESQ